MKANRIDQLNDDLTFNREQYRIISTNLRFAAQRIDLIKKELAEAEAERVKDALEQFCID